MSRNVGLIAFGLFAVALILMVYFRPRNSEHSVTRAPIENQSNRSLAATGETPSEVAKPHPAFQDPKSELGKSFAAIPGGSDLTGSTIKVKRRRKNINPEDAIFESDSNSHVTRKTASLEASQGDTPDAAMKDVEWVFRDKENEVSPAEAVNSVKRYAQALYEFRNHSNRRSLELLYRIGMRAAGDLTFVVRHMDERTFKRIEQDMEGFALNRERIFTVTPLTEFFADLAQNEGGSADRAYFQTIEDYQIGDLPKHSRRINDLLTCINFGDGNLVKDYSLWVSYQRRFPKHYDFEVKEKIDEVTRSLTENNCACGSKSDVYAEFKKFIKAYPGSGISQELKTRMANIDREPADFRFHCKSNSDVKF